MACVLQVLVCPLLVYIIIFSLTPPPPIAEVINKIGNSCSCCVPKQSSQSFVSACQKQPVIEPYRPPSKECSENWGLHNKLERFLLHKISRSLFLSLFLSLPLQLCFALSMLGNPYVTLLDEPSTGMDPKAKQHMW